MSMIIEGELHGLFVRIRYRNPGDADMHPVVKVVADAVAAEGRYLQAHPLAPGFTTGYYDSPEAFLALMRATLNKVTKVEGAPRQEPSLAQRMGLRGIQ